MTSSAVTPNLIKHLIEQYKTEAKKLHRAICSGQTSYALPVLRRVLKAKVFVDISLVNLFNEREKIKRKHLFTLLAKEAGYGNWPELKKALLAGKERGPLITDKSLFFDGYPNLWFSNMEQAETYAEANGGLAVKVGEQAMVKVE